MSKFNIRGSYTDHLKPFTVGVFVKKIGQEKRYIRIQIVIRKQNFRWDLLSGCTVANNLLKKVSIAMLRILSFFILIYTSCLLQAQSLDLISLSHAEFVYERNKWGEELFLKVTGSAHEYLKDGNVMVSLWYREGRVRWQSLPLEYNAKNSRNRFAMYWGPLNRAYEKVLSGKYKVEVSFPLDHQPALLRKKLIATLSQRKISPSTREIVFGDKDSFAKEDIVIRQFYKGQLKQLYNLYMGLKKNAQNTLNSKNTVSRDWEIQFDKFLGQWKEIERNLNRFHKKTFFRRYPKIKSGVVEFHNLLLRLAKVYSQKIYKQLKTTGKQKYTNLDSFGLKKVVDIDKNLQRLFKNTQAYLRSQENSGND